MKFETIRRMKFLLFYLVRALGSTKLPWGTQEASLFFLREKKEVSAVVAFMREESLS